MLGMDVKGADNIVRSARNRGLKYGGLGGAVFGAGALVLAAILSVKPSRPQAVVEGETLSTSSDDSDSVFPRTDDGATLLRNVHCP